MQTNISKLVSKLASMGIWVWIENGELCYRAPKGSMTPTLLDELTQCKQELLAVLANKLSAPITSSHRYAPIPVSFGQQRLWMLDQLAPGNPAYNMLCPVKLSGRLHKYCLARAINAVVTRHEILRTIILNSDSELEQRVLPALHIKLPIFDLTRLPENFQKKECARVIKTEGLHSFNLATGPLLRSMLLELDTDLHVLVFTLHHIVADGWSMGQLKREMAVCYDSFYRSKINPLPNLPIQYADYACWQRQQLSGYTLDRLLAYWRDKLHGAPALLTLPTYRARTTITYHRGSTCPLYIDAALQAQLQKLAKHHSATLYMVLLAALAILLSRYSGQHDLCVGTPIANRHRLEIENLIGFFVNTLVLRIRLRPEWTFSELLTHARNTALDAYEHQDLPFEYLVEKLAPMRNLDHHPLFQVMLILQNTSSDFVQVDSIHLEDYQQHPGTTKFDLTFDLLETSGGISGQIEYNTDLFTSEQISRLGQHWAQLLGSIANQPNTSLGELDMLSAQERQQMLVYWNSTRQSHPLHETIHSLFEQQVERTPQSIALIVDRQHISYDNLNVRANRLAHLLISQGIGSEQRIGVCLPRGLNQIIAILGILKAGAAYVPLDPNQPPDRWKSIALDSAFTLMLTDTSIDNAIHSMLPDLRILNLGEIQPQLEKQSVSNPKCTTLPDNLVYVIYTSGSTGKAKGVMGTHGACINRFHWMWDRYPFHPGERHCQKTSLSFVDSVWEIFGPLLQGIPSVGIAESDVFNTDIFLSVLQRQSVSRLVVVPTLLKRILVGDDITHKLRRIKLCTCSGEHLPIKLAQLFYRHLPDAILINIYGSTEVAADVTYSEVTPDSTPIRVGYPLSNICVYILDSHGSPVPYGVQGELYVGGNALARGYLSHASETAEKFIPDPFNNSFGKRLYRTGDLATWTADGQIILFGRRDRQIKLHGIRIEPCEVEAQLRTHPKIKDAAVTLYSSDDEHDVLVGHVVAKCKDAKPSSANIASFLYTRLPRYAIPHIYVYLDDLPVTSSGKVNYMTLASSGPTSHKTGHHSPRDILETLLVQLWEETLNIRPIGIRDGFFELGGNSFLAVLLLEKIHQRVGPLLTLPDLYKESTIGYWRDALEHKIQEICVDVLDIPRVDMEENLYNLGADDLKTVRILNRIKNDIGIDLTMFDIFEASTCYKLIDIIQTRFFHEGVGQTNVSRLPYSYRSSLKTIASGDKKLPLFLVIPFGGLLPPHSSVSIEGLGQHFSPGRPVYTLLPPLASQDAIELFVKLYNDVGHPDFLQHRDIHTWRPDAQAIQRMATQCIQTMKTAQPMGPYLLAGYSSGGVIAFEMAQQLTQLGEKVKFLALMDTLLPRHVIPDDSMPAVLDTDLLNAQEVAWFVTRAFGGAAELRLDYQSMVDVLRATEPAKRWTHVLSRLKSKHIVPQDTSLYEIMQIYRTYRIYSINSWIINETMADYMPRKYLGRVTLLRAADAYQEMADKTLGWREVIQDPIDIHTLPGDHATFLWPDNLKQVAHVLEMCIETH